MLRKALKIGAVALVSVLLVGALAVWAQPSLAQGGFGRGQSSSCRPATAGQGLGTPLAGDTASTELSESEKEALLMALDDEYKAWAIYDQVIADFGAVRPFTQIQKAEESHIAALVRLFERYDLEVPENEWPGNVPTFESVADACAAGVQAEVDNGAVYDELFSMVDNPDIVRVFTSLQRASLTKHLPAFERCAS